MRELEGEETLMMIEGEDVWSLRMQKVEEDEGFDEKMRKVV